MTENQNNFFTIDDVFREIDKQEPIDLGKVYDPLHFWEDYGDKYFRAFQKPNELSRHVGWIVGRLKSLKAETVLDVGCGFGRLAPFIIEADAAKKYVGIDISQKQLDCVGEYLSSIVDNVAVDPIKLAKATPEQVKKLQEEEKVKLAAKMDHIKKHVTFQRASAKRTPFEANSFDCVVSLDVFGFLPVSSVRHILSDIKRVTKKYVIVVERYVYPGEHPQPHIWSHDYSALVGLYGYTVLESKLIANGVIGMILEK